MRTIRIISLFLTLITYSQAFVAPLLFREQIERADAIARIVVVQIAKLDYMDQEEWTFKGMAKCRIVTDYTGVLKNADFVYIPCDYAYDESPSPLEVGRDYRGLPKTPFSDLNSCHSLLLLDRGGRIAGVLAGVSGLWHFPGAMLSRLLAMCADEWFISRCSASCGPAISGG